jgi:hypothetical protein
MAQALFKRTILKLRDNLLLARARETVGAYSATQQAEIRRLFDAAERRARAAGELCDDRYMPVALGLLSEAGRCYTAALLLSRDPAFEPGDLDPAVLFERIDALVADGTLGPAPDGYQAARGILSQRKPFAFDEFSPSDMSASRETVEPTLQWLRDLVEPRSLVEVRRAGVVRIATVVGAVVACVWVACWLVSLALRPPNVALHRPVTESSQWPGSPAPAGVTNGEIEIAYGAATGSENNPWIKVDLADPYRLHSITVHQRVDGHFAQGFPMCVEISEDDKDWVEIGRRDEPSAGDWTISTKKRARYVRVRSIGVRLLALTEIEVRGRR